MNGKRRARQTGVNPRSEWRVRQLRAQAANRDGWVCYRCRRPIDPRLKYPHPASVSLEHRTDLILGGDPYTLSNCAVSHLLCNTQAGAVLGTSLRHGASRRTGLTWRSVDNHRLWTT